MHKHAQDEYWISIVVLLSRVSSLDHMLLLRLPDRRFLEGGPPKHLAAWYEHYRTMEIGTLRRLDDKLARANKQSMRALVSEPLLRTLLQNKASSAVASSPAKRRKLQKRAD